MFVEVSYRTRYPLNFPEILSGMKSSAKFEPSCWKVEYESDPEAWNTKWNDDLETYKADLQFMWSLVLVQGRSSCCAADRLRRGLMQTADDADAGGMRFLRGIDALLHQARGRKIQKGPNNSTKASFAVLTN